MSMAQQIQIFYCKVIAKITYLPILVLIFFLLPARSIAQQTELLKSRLASLELLGDDYSLRTAGEIKSLYSEIHPTIHLSDGMTHRYGETAPELVDCDISSIPLIYNDNALYANARMLIIHLTQPADLLQQIDVSRLVGFSGLKYICFLVSFDSCPGEVDKNGCVPAKVNKMILNSSGRSLQYLTTVEIPE